MTPEAHEYLTKRCKIMRRLIRAHGPCTIAIDTTMTPFQSLVRAVARLGLTSFAPQLRKLAAGPDPALAAAARDAMKAMRLDATAAGRPLIAGLKYDDVVATAEKVLKAAFGDKFMTTPPGTPSEDFSEYAIAGVPSMFFNIGIYEPERAAAARNGTGPQLPANHSPLFAPVPRPTIETGVTAMTLAVLSAFDERAGEK